MLESNVSYAAVIIQDERARKLRKLVDQIITGAALGIGTVCGVIIGLHPAVML